MKMLPVTFLVLGVIFLYYAISDSKKSKSSNSLAMVSPSQVAIIGSKSASDDGRFVWKDVKFSPGFYGKTAIMTDTLTGHEYFFIEGTGAVPLSK